MLRFYSVSYIEAMKLPMPPDETKVCHTGEEDATLPVF
jgi:hypothetical protein